MTESYLSLQDKILYEFKDPSLLKTALTHSSTGEEANYERLEFLGDRVLGLVIASMLYQKFPDEKEGDLAKRLASLVQGETLAKLSSQIDLSTYMIVSDGAVSTGALKNQHLLADVFEAVIGAIYLDGGYAPCERLIQTYWEDVFFTMVKPPQHPKTALQEWAQAQGYGLPAYVVKSQSGPDHAPVFEIELTVLGHEPVNGKGKSRAEAEKNAATLFMKDVKLPT